MVNSREFRFAIDRGGTFTDVFAEVPDGKGGLEPKVCKLLSEDPANYPDAPREGIRRILEQVTGIPHPRNKPLDTSRIDTIRMGTTVATNALLERKGERTALVTTAGFADLLFIGNQARPQIFDLRIRTPDLLYERVVEVDEQVVLPLGDVAGGRAGTDPANVSPRDEATSKATTGEDITVRKAPDRDAVRAQLQEVLDVGIKSIAVCLKHAAIFPDHEQLIGDVAAELGFEQISLSHDVMPMVKMVPRGFTAAASAYLTPHIKRYIKTFQAGFDEGIKDVQVSFMQSDGGLAPVERFAGHKAILSGPAGGYVGYALTTRWNADQKGEDMQIIGFDMGGTSTDVSRFAGTFEHVFESTTAGVTIQAPQLDINTVAAGGGSRLFFRSGIFVVGPESCGAHPGPVCYKKNGYLAITDANLLLGRILPAHFPKIFGPNEDEPLDEAGTRAAFDKLTVEVNAYGKEAGLPPKSVDEVAMGFLRVANEAMCRPIRALTQMKGYDAAAHVLACFGGAGGQHACAIARALGMRTIFVQRFSGILSAVGIALADLVHEAQSPCAKPLDAANKPALDAELARLEAEAMQGLYDQNIDASRVTAERYLNLRYEGTDVPIMTPAPAGVDWRVAFEDNYMREFGFKLEDRPIVVDDCRARAVGKVTALPAPPKDAPQPPPLPAPLEKNTAFFDATGRVDVPLWKLADLKPGSVIPGPAMIIDQTATVVVEPHCTAHVTALRDIKIDVEAPPRPIVAAAAAADAAAEIDCDPIQLAIFSHRFMGIAEQMGHTLARTSISVNIKERLDFSCALFDPTGALVANAPHLPVHLGAMSEAVRFQVRYYTTGPGKDEGLKEGDVLVSNHPQKAGGSHLPDITVITPVFHDGKIVFFVASRGHHADIGGISPGSMPPTSKSLVEEGATIVSFKLVKAGKFQENGLVDLLMAPGKLGIPGVVGTRNLSDNVSDLKAQVAANNRGIQLLSSLVDEYSLEEVQAYMRYIQANAEEAVRDMLVSFSKRVGLPPVGAVTSESTMDDGSPIRLRVTIDRNARSAHFDFTGTGPEIYGNCNAPPAVTYSAIIYSLRCMVESDIPLNQGCLAPITVHIPPGTLLSPSDTAAVVGGNVLTSQRVTDVVLKAFDAAAASQGCMNNFTFGDADMGYYETIAGGAGAGPGWNGRSGVHTHMTNTRITDPEILERRYPLVLHKFAIRKGSGGAGKFRGGDGVVREVEFMRPMMAGILSERRSTRPFGILGGGDGLSGQNLVIRHADGRVLSLGGKSTIALEAADRFRIITPGGGGCGHLKAEEAGDEDARMERHMAAHKEGEDSVAVRDTGSVLDYKRAQETV